MRLSRQRPRGGRDALVVGAGHRPHGRLVAGARGRDEAGPGAERPHGPPARVEGDDPASVGARAGVDPAPRGARLELAQGVVVPRGDPRADDDAQRVLDLGRAEAALRSGDVERVHRLEHRVARRRRRVGALDPHRQPPAAAAVQERLGERADDRGHAHRGAPVVAVPPDPVARVQAHGRRALRRLDPVDVEEPVQRAPRPPAPGGPVDALDETAAEPGRHPGVALEQAHHGLGARHLRRLELARGARPEVLRDRQPRAAGRLARPGAAAGRQRRERSEEREQRRRPPSSSERRTHCGCGPDLPRCRG